MLQAASLGLHAGSLVLQNLGIEFFSKFFPISFYPSLLNRRTPLLLPLTCLCVYLPSVLYLYNFDLAPNRWCNHVVCQSIPLCVHSFPTAPHWLLMILQNSDSVAGNLTSESPILEKNDPKEKTAKVLEICTFHQ